MSDSNAIFWDRLQETEATGVGQSMTLRCAACGRPLQAFALLVQTKNGPIGFGPVCARVRGLLSAESKTAAPVKSHGTTNDPAQLQLEFA